MVNIGNDWDDLLDNEFKKPYYSELKTFLKSEYESHSIYPEMNDIFNALRYTAYNDVKTVILGQDPYHQPGQAHGLCFSVKKGIKPPPSLLNIYKELKSDLSINPPEHGELTSWAKSGVLLLNTVLTVRKGQPNSHKGRGWEFLTDRIIELLNERNTPLVFMLWGANAQKKAVLISNPVHMSLTAAHPSPLSAYNGFFGCKHFSKANIFLEQNGVKTIDFKIDN